MKTHLIGIALGLLTALTASGQNQSARQHDPMYSTHNYKHHDKAAAATKWANKKGIEVTTPGYDPQRLANYKQSKSGVSPAVGIAVPHTPSTTLAERNYKIQRVGAARPDTQLVSKPRPPAIPEGD